MNRITSSIPPALSNARHRGEVRGDRQQRLAEAESWGTAPLICGNTVSPRCATLPSVLNAGIESFASGPSPCSEALIAGAWAWSTCERRVDLARQRGQPLRRRFELAQERREVLQVLLDRGALLRGGDPDLADVLDEAADVGPLRGERGEDLVGLVGQAGEEAVLVGEHRDHLVGLLERRIGAQQRRVELVAVAGEADAEPGDDELQALLLGQARDVGDQVDADRRGRVLHRQQVLALVRAGGDRRQHRGAARQGPGCVGVHCTNCSPSSDSSPISQWASVRNGTN